MPDKQHLTAKVVADALVEMKGMVYLTAKKLRVSHSTIYNYINRYASVRLAKEQAGGETTDVAELKLYQAIQSGEPWAVQFQLKTKGRTRGYVERQEITGGEGKEVIIKVVYDDNKS